MVYVIYLASGLAGAPSNRVDVFDLKSLAMEMAAVIRNVMAETRGAMEASSLRDSPRLRWALEKLQEKGKNHDARF